MKLKPALFFATMLFSISSLYAQTAKSQKRKLNQFGFAFTNSHTAMPFSRFGRLITGNYHPGIEVSTGFNWRSAPKHDWTQTFTIGYSYHRWVQHSIVLYSEFGYRLKLGRGFFSEARLGAGYMRAIIATEVFSDGVEDGKQYSNISSGRSQGIASFEILAGRQFKTPLNFRCFVAYQQRLQTPFIHSYVPLLPHNILKIGVAIPIKKS